MRSWLWCTVWAMGAVLSGCGPEETETEPPPFGQQPVVDDETADTGYYVYDPKLVDEVRFRAFIAWDAMSQQVVSPVIDGSDGYISSYRIDIYEEGWSDNNENSFCKVSIDLEGYLESLDALGEGYVWGIDIPQGDVVAYETCTDKGWAPEAFLDGSPLNDWGQYEYKLRLGGVMSGELIDWLTPDTPPTDFDIDEYVAGNWTTDAGLTTDEDSNFWYGYAMDMEYNVDFDTRLKSYEMTDGTGALKTGYYVFDQRVYWSFDNSTGR